MLHLRSFVALALALTATVSCSRPTVARDPDSRSGCIRRRRLAARRRMDWASSTVLQTVAGRCPARPKRSRKRATLSASGDAFAGGIPDSAGIGDPRSDQGRNLGVDEVGRGPEATAQGVRDRLVASYGSTRGSGHEHGFSTDARLSAVGRCTDRA